MNAEIQQSLRNVNPTVLERLRAKFADPFGCTEVGVRNGVARFRYNDEGQLVAVCRFGRSVYEKRVDVDTAVAMALNLARVVGYSAGRGRMVLEVQAGGR